MASIINKFRNRKNSVQSKGRELNALPRSPRVHRWFDRLWLMGRDVSRIVLVLLAIAVLVPATAAGLVAISIFEVPPPRELPDEAPVPRARPTIVYDIDGREIATFREFDLTADIEIDDIPEVLVQAVLAVEDKRFYEHPGVDPEGIARAAYANWAAKRTEQGGSTLTQQYVKNTYLDTTQTYERKFNEALLALALERQLGEQEADRVEIETGTRPDEAEAQRLAKDVILFRYLDTSYFGDGNYGVGAAAESWFSKPVNELSLSEAALIAGMLRSPGETAPRINPERADQRRRLVLQLMLEQNRITQAQHDEAATFEVRRMADGFNASIPATWVWQPKVNGVSDYPFFVDYVKKYLTERYGDDAVLRGGLRVRTTLNPEIQIMAREVVADSMSRVNADFPLQMSLVSVDPRNGFVRALVGGADFEQSQVNMALAPNQPGSTMKAFVLAAALQRGAQPDKVYPTSGRFCYPEKPDTCLRGAGPQSPRSAIVRSDNAFFGQFTSDVGPNVVAQTAHDMGLATFDPEGVDYGTSVGLGGYAASPLDMASSFGTLANRGRHQEVTPVSFVTDEFGNVIEDNRVRTGVQVVDESVADHVNDMMRGVLISGTAKGTSIGRPAAGKTGTTNDSTNTWFVGYTPQLSTAVWYGYEDRYSPVKGYRFGGDLAPTWRRFMNQALEDEPVIDFSEPGPLPRPEAPQQFSRSEVGRTLNGADLLGRRARAQTPLGCLDGACDVVEYGTSVVGSLLPPPYRPGSVTPVAPSNNPPTTAAPATTTTTEPEEEVDDEETESSTTTTEPPETTTTVPAVTTTVAPSPSTTEAPTTTQDVPATSAP